MARIFKRGKYWWVDYRLPDGRRIRRSTGFTDKKMAELMLKDIELQIARKTLHLPVDISIEEFWEKYLEYAKLHKTENSWKTDYYVFREFLEFLHQKNVNRLTKLNAEILEKYKLHLLEKGNKKVTVNKKLRTIKAIISKAVEWDLLPENPCKKVKLFKQPEGRLRFLTKEEINRLLEVINREDVYLYTIILLNTGLRRAEFVNLRWEDVDFNDGILRVINRDGFTTKNYRNRTIPLSKKTLEAFKRLKELNPKKPCTLSQDQLSRVISHYAKKAGLHDVTCHTLRHTFASHLVMKGIDLVTIKKLMGHLDLNTTLIYAKVTEEHKLKAISSIDLTE
jgi:site-specific recombinase XerD